MKEREESRAVATDRRAAHAGKLMRYLCGGGLEAFTRTPAEERAETRQERFLAAAALVGVGWLLFWIF